MLPIAAVLPSWKEMMDGIKDEEIFPKPREVAEEEAMVVGNEAANDMANTDDATNNEATATNKTETTEEPAYSEWGMLMGGGGDLAPITSDEEEPTNDKKSNDSASSMEKPKPTTDTTSVEMDVVDDEKDATIEDSTPQEVLTVLDSLQSGVLALQPKIDKFLAKLYDVSCVMLNLQAMYIE